MTCQDTSEGVSIETLIGSNDNLSLVARMPSFDISAKIGIKKATPQSLASRMPSPQVVAMVGISTINRTMRRVQRLNAV